jgi:hypothetical protein
VAIEGVAIPIPREPRPEAEPPLRRLRAFAWFLDRSIPIGGKYRIGIDPLLGLIPGFGDWLGALMSLYILYAGARLGVPVGVLAHMAGNILLEAMVGAVPVLGDLFDFAWQANVRNVQLIEQHYRPELRGRTLRTVWLALLVFAIVVLSLLGALVYVVARGIVAVFR